jgi:hypothetical protein
MIESFIRHWPHAVNFYGYCEHFLVDDISPNVHFRSLEESCPSLVVFKERHQENPKAHGKEILEGLDARGKRRGKGFRWDAVRFAHKVYAVTHAGRTLTEDVMFWMDADTITFERIPPSFLDRLLPDENYLCYLGRPKKDYTECGFVGYNLRHRANEAFMARFQQYYDEDLIFDESEWHDAYIFDIVRREFEESGAVENRSLTPTHVGSHAFINSELGNYMDHLKGKRKELGRSSSRELKVERDQPYWRA